MRCRFPRTLPAPDHPVVREIRGEFRFVLVHAGNLGFYGAWETLLQAASMLEPDGVGLVFIGEGAMKGKDRSNGARDCRNVRFLPFRPADEVPYVMAAGDLHVVTVKRGLEGVVVPSKVYKILAAGARCWLWPRTRPRWPRLCRTRRLRRCSRPG